MKKFFAMALVALTIASCSKGQIENPELPGGGGEINTSTYATFKFNIGGGTKAAADFNPSTTPEQDAADKKIGTLQLLIFNATSQSLEHNSVLTAGETSKTVLLTAGKKKIFFVANSNKLTTYQAAIAPATFAPGQPTSTLSAFNAMVFDAGTPQTIATPQTGNRSFDFSALYTESVAGTAGLPMTNTNEVTYTLKAGVTEAEAQGGVADASGVSNTNTFKIQLYYMTAKARLVLGADVLSAGDAVSKPVIKDVTYSIRNLARQTNYVQNVPTAGKPLSFYYTKTFADQAAFDKEFDYASNIVIPAAATPGNYLYVPENNHELLLRGQSSYFAIKATFEPVVISAVDYNLNTKVAYTYATLATTTPTNGNYIFTVKDVQGIPAGTYFKTLALLEKAAWMMQNAIPFIDGTHEAEAKLLVKPADYMSFVNATSYYRVDIGSGVGADTAYGVLRSNKYDATINKITGPGVPDEGGLIVDPTDPVSAKTYINATIVPAEWTPVTQSADL